MNDSQDEVVERILETRRLAEEKENEDAWWQEDESPMDTEPSYQNETQNEKQ